MKRWLLLVVALVLSSCQSAVTARARHIATSSPPPATKSSAARPAYRSVCAGFEDFYAVMTSRPPSQDADRLLEIAQTVDRTPGSVRMHRLADALVSYVAAPSFVHEGNVAGKPVQDLSDACF